MSPYLPHHWAGWHGVRVGNLPSHCRRSRVGIRARIASSRGNCVRRLIEMARAAAAGSLADTFDEYSWASAGLSLCDISIASPLVLSEGGAGGASQRQPGLADASDNDGDSSVLCEVDLSRGSISIRSASSAAGQITCGVTAAQPVASAEGGSSAAYDQCIKPTSAFAGWRSILCSGAQLQHPDLTGHSLAQPALDLGQASDPSAYGVHPALADSALHLGAVKAPSQTDRQRLATPAERSATKVPVAMRGYWVPCACAAPVPWTQPRGDAGRWAVSEAPELHRDRSGVNDVWLLGHNAGSCGMQAKGLVSKAIGNAKVRGLLCVQQGWEFLSLHLMLANMIACDKRVAQAEGAEGAGPIGL